MRAIVYSSYGSAGVLSCRDVAMPVAGDNDVLIRVRAASVNPFDWHSMRGTPYFIRLSAGLLEPKDGRLGVDVAGEVESVGRNVSGFKPGDAVAGVCRGAFAEYACAPEPALAMKPENISFEQAASAYVASLTALQGLRDRGHIGSGQTVLINGASGGVGTFAVQLARHFGAGVTAVCSGKNADLVRSLGAGRIIDYTRESFTKGAGRYDLILDCIGNHSLLACRRALNREGVYVAVGGPAGRWMFRTMARAIAGPLLSRFVHQDLSLLMMRRSKQDFAFICDLMSSGKIKPVIDRRYSLADVAEAIRYVEAGHSRGKVVIVLER